MKAGFDFRILYDYGIPASGPTSLSFSSVFTQEYPSTAVAGTGPSLATILLGNPTGGSKSLISPFDESESAGRQAFAEIGDATTDRRNNTPGRLDFLPTNVPPNLPVGWDASCYRFPHSG